MPITPHCDKCKQPLDDFGAIVLSPPDERERVRKYHICKACYAEMEKEFSEKKI